MQHRKKPPPPPAAAPQDVLKYLAVKPPVEEEGVQPSVANYVNVSGTTDLMTLEFYYVSDHTYSRAYRKVPGTGIEREGDRAVIRATPAARVAVPASVAADLVMQMIQC